MPKPAAKTTPNFHQVGQLENLQSIAAFVVVLLFGSFVCCCVAGSGRGLPELQQQVLLLLTRPCGWDFVWRGSPFVALAAPAGRRAGSGNLEVSSDNRPRTCVFTFVLDTAGVQEARMSAGGGVVHALI